jgi:hypothetical protein
MRQTVIKNTLVIIFTPLLSSPWDTVQMMPPKPGAGRTASQKATHSRVMLMPRMMLFDVVISE